MSRLGRWTRALGRRCNRAEPGYAMVMALIVLSVGSLIIPPTLEYMSTGVKSAAIQKKLTDEMYAAEAGVEYAKLRIMRNEAQNTYNTIVTAGSISANVTSMPLSSLPYGPVLTGTGEHSEWASVSETLQAAGEGVYTYTIRVENVATSVVHLAKIGAGLPKHYTYVAGSSSGVATPQNSILYVTGTNVRWEFPSSGPTLQSGEYVTQSFQITGSGGLERYYSWTQANREDIGIISNAEGYNVVSTAGGTTVEANVVEMQNFVFPISWEIR